MTDPATMHRYPFTALRGDYIRSIAGIVLTGIPLLFAGSALVPNLILGALVAMFGLFGIRTWLRQISLISVEPEAIHLRRIGQPGRDKTVAWAKVDSVRLAYYSTRRDKAHGWMTLKIRGNGTALSVDSMIDGFDDISLVAAKAAADQGLVLSDTSIRNFAALGIIVDSVDGRAVGARKDSIF